MIVLIFIISFIPGLFYLWLIWRLDKYDPEPRKWLALSFFLGILSVFPATLAEELVDYFIFPYWDAALNGDLTSSLVSSFLVVAPVEEALKIWAIIIIIANKKIFDEPMDALVYGAASSLGFASLENAMYCLKFGTNIYVARAILTVPAHILFSTAWAWGIGMWRFKIKGASGNVILVLSFLLSVILHGTYNILAITFTGYFLPGAIILLIVMGIIAAGAFFHFRKISPMRWSQLPPGLRTMQQLSAKAIMESGLSFTWIIISSLIFIVTISFFSILIGTITRSSSQSYDFFINPFDTRKGPLTIPSSIIIIILFGICFILTGIITGRISKSKTIVEPAIASIITMTLLIVIFAPNLGSDGLLLLLVTGPVFAGLSCFGGWLGELWQDKSLKKH